MNFIEELNNAPNIECFANRLKNLSETELNSLFFLLSSYTLTKGKKLYRIVKQFRTSEMDIEWGIRKNKGEKGRFNKSHNILYVAESEIFLQEECEIKKDKSYYMGEYSIVEDFCVGTCKFPSEKYPNISYYLQGLFNASSPDKSDIIAKNNLTINTANKMYPLLEPLFIGHIFGEKIYEYTNFIGDNIIKHNPNGIAYPSSFDSIYRNYGNKTLQLQENILNLALTEEGYSHIKFIGYNPKIGTLTKSTERFETIIELYKEDENK